MKKSEIKQTIREIVMGVNPGYKSQANKELKILLHRIISKHNVDLSDDMINELYDGIMKWYNYYTS